MLFAVSVFTMSIFAVSRGSVARLVVGGVRLAVGVGLNFGGLIVSGLAVAVTVILGALSLPFCSSRRSKK